MRTKLSPPSAPDGLNRPHKRGPGARTTLALCIALGWAAALAPAQAAQATAPVSTQAAAAYWQSVPVPSESLTVGGGRQLSVKPRKFHAAALDKGGMQSLTAGAPMERRDGAVIGEQTISLPHPDGGYQRFVIVESPVMEPGLAAKHPGIKTYKGKGVDDPGATLRMDITPLGLHASVRSPAGGWYVDPYYHLDDSLYASYHRRDLPNQHGPLLEKPLADARLTLTRGFYQPGEALEVRGAGFAPGASVSLTVRAEGDSAPLRTVTATADQDGTVKATLTAEPNGTPGAYEVTATDGRNASTAAYHVVREGAAVEASTGTQLRTYRLALVSDPSYASYFGAANVTAAKVTLINRVTQIYEDETSIRLVLIDATDKLNLNTAAEMTGANGPCGPTACYTPSQAASCGSSLLGRNRIVTGLLAGASNFDVGHIALGLNGGGIASLGVVGASAKAQGCTGVPTPVGDLFAVDYVAHELGHQFAGNHTFNGVNSSCSGGNRNDETSVEPGSGSSIMAYAGICSTDNLQPHSDPYWSQRSFDEVVTYVNSAESVLNELQMVVLRQFASDGQQFQVRWNGKLSAPIVRGRNYNVGALKEAIQSIDGWPAGGTVAISAVSDTGFTATFSGAFAGTNVAQLEIVNCTGGCSAIVGEITAGGPTARGGKVSATGNQPPVVTVAAGYTIPLRTPFALTGSAVDPDGDPLTYLWEQNDRGGNSGTGLLDNTKTNGPLFRQFGIRAVVTSAGTIQYNSPGENHVTADPTRVFPDIAQILANNTNAETGACPTPASNPTAADIDCFSEFLPTADYVGLPGVNPRALNFRVTARDGQGGVGSASTRLTLAPEAGPFRVTSHNAAATVDSGSTQTVTWSVANTNAAPVNTQNVRITLSVDGGKTFPHVLAASTPNSGSKAVTLPALASKTARIKVEAIGNVFFDVSNANFAIRLAGDVNADGSVDCGDLGVVRGALGKRTGQPGYDSRADVNRDGVVDIRDLSGVSQHVAKGTACS
ncbi:M12 family metallo-peptidase [Pseudoduganella chitinolytica]|uniref:M12 family metallo-peptidase n=1 Tax=Pseudoduganella chitinolytica TaxID=34070 RepID=A0ABY8BKP4_9BURK|nr:M12 family metallo-peptidase [Pseudoduganella chitinolytica]WEF35533.1 M12 family metallo-peptidase [Pseudoduganella chitinolytica]